VEQTTELLDFYSGHTPRLQRFNHMPDQRHAPGTTPAAEVLPALVMVFANWVTWLAGVGPRTVGRMSGLPPRHSFGCPTWTTISDGRTQKLRLTHQPGFFTVALNPRIEHDILGIVSQFTHRQALLVLMLRC